MENTITIPARELPIHRRARAAYANLWDVFDATIFCRELCGRPMIPTITAEEYRAAAIVAQGGSWPVPCQTYTRAQWEKDENFSPVPGQEVDESVYNYMLDVLPPLRLPRNQRTHGYCAGFMVGEADCSDPATGHTYYSAFGKKDGKCYYIGLLTPTKAIRTPRW